MKKIHVICLLLFTAIVMIGNTDAATLNVVNYGAIAGDDLDDLAAIQSAVDASGSGDTVYFPGGKYLINGKINGKSSIKLAGENKNDSIIQYTSNIQDTMIDISGLSNVEISGLKLVGNEYGTKGIVATSGSGHFIHDLIIRDFTSSQETFILGIHFGINVTNSVISDNIIENMGVGSKWGGGIRLSWGSSGNQILRNSISQTGRGGIFADNNSGSNIYRFNTVTGCGKTAEGLGLEIWVGCGNSIIEDNVIDHWLSVAGSPNTSVRRNIVSAKDSTFAAIGLELVDSNNCILTDNTVDEGAHIGISISGPPEKNNVFWGYNVIRHCTTWGMQMQGEDGGTNRHYFYANKFNDTYKDHPKALYFSQGHGVRFNSNDFNITFEANEFSYNGNAGIQFLGNLESFSFINNEISNNFAVYSETFSGQNLEFENNICKSNKIGNFQPKSKGFTNKKPASDFNFITNGLEVNFVDASADSDGVISYYLWDFNDGLPSIDKNPVHIYSEDGTYRITLIVWDDSGRGARMEKMITVPGVVNVEEEENTANLKPAGFQLYQNNPNPFNSYTSLRFSNGIPGHAVFTLHNTTGQQVDVLADGYYAAGEHELRIDASGLSTGVYFVKMKAENSISSIKMLYLR